MLKLGFYSGAYYLAGYAVECELKACIARQTMRHDFPDKKQAVASHTHELMQLVRMADLEEAHREAIRTNDAFRKNWETVEAWSEESRYAIYHKSSAAALVDAVGNLDHGVLAWVRRH